MHTLQHLKNGETARISAFANEEIPTRMYELGLIPGQLVQMKCRAPFNGPVCICYGDKGCKLALRSEEARCILIERL